MEFLLRKSRWELYFFFSCLKDQIRNSQESKFDDVDRFSLKAPEKDRDISLHHLTILPSQSYEIHSKTPINFDDDFTDNQMFTRINPVMDETTNISPEIYSENDSRILENSIILENGYQQDDDGFMMSNELCDTCQIR